MCKSKALFFRKVSSYILQIYIWYSGFNAFSMAIWATQWGISLFYLLTEKLKSYSTGHWCECLLAPTLRPSTPMLVGCRSSHCCVFVLIITCDVRNTMGQAESTGFVMQGEHRCQNTGLKERQAGGGRWRREGERNRAGREESPTERDLLFEHFIRCSGGPVNSSTCCAPKLKGKQQNFRIYFTGEHKVSTATNMPRGILGKYLWNYPDTIYNHIYRRWKKRPSAGLCALALHK